MKGFKKLLFATITASLAATMLWSIPVAKAQTPVANAPIIETATAPAPTPLDKQDHRNAKAPKITYEQASEIALKEVGGGYVKEIDLEYKRRYGGLVYEVEVRKDYVEYEVYVDAETGEVLRIKRD